MIDMSFNPFEPNGFTTYVMNSAEIADNVIETFERAINMGMEPTDALSYSLQSNKVNEDDLLSVDIERINARINELI